MNRNTYKLKMWASINGDLRFIALFLDMNSVTGFYIPDREDDDGVETVNLLFGAEIITVKQEPHLIKFLRKAFIDTGVS